MVGEPMRDGARELKLGPSLMKMREPYKKMGEAYEDAPMDVALSPELGEDYEYAPLESPLTPRSRQALWSYAGVMRNRIKGKVALKLDPADKRKIEDAIDCAIQYVADNQLTEEEYDAKLKEIDGICTPILIKIAFAMD